MNQVLQIEQMQHLKELGVDTKNASMCYRRMTRNYRGEIIEGRYVLSFNQPIISSNFETYEVIPTFTLQDILDLLPVIIENDYNKLELRIKRFVYDNDKIMYAVLYEKQDYIDWLIMHSNENLIDSAYDMLCWCAENGYLKD